MKKYSYKVYDSHGSTVASGECEARSPETAEQILSEFVARPMEVMLDKQDQGGWTFLAGESEYSVTIK